MINQHWDKEDDIDIGVDAFIVTHLESIHICSGQDAWNTVVINHNNITLLRDRLNEIISRLDLKQ